MRKRLFIKTYGCQMNVYDSHRMADLLAPLGYDMVDEPRGADMAILNTCHIREKATEKLFSDLGRLHPFKREKQSGGEDMILAVAGCVAQAEGPEIRRRAPYVDMVFGPQTYHRLPEMVAKAARGAGAILDTDFPVESKFDFLPEQQASQGPAAFLSIQEGCDKFCTFCVVPYTRGAETSRPAAAILKEAEILIAGGAKEITLLGQNVNAYHGEGVDGGSWNLATLLNELAKLPGVERLRYTTSHPKDMNDELIAAHRDNEKLMPFLHLPIQSGSDAVLTAMNRNHSADDYRRIVEKLRHARADLALSSDFIVGFPGESDQDFAATLALVKEIGFAQAYSFKYSPRPGTPASAYDKQVPENVKQARLEALQQEIMSQQLAFNRAAVGREMPVLLDRPGKKDGQLIGRSPYMQSTFIDAPPRLLGEIVTVKVTQGFSNSITGDMVTVEMNGLPAYKYSGAAA
ncbi:MAG: tRNA (N6-isopentenyl adenosine(37)-C2)-methylthiotransferase MiaB [Dongiaceae bacterium]